MSDKYVHALAIGKKHTSRWPKTAQGPFAKALRNMCSIEQWSSLSFNFLLVFIPVSCCNKSCLHQIITTIGLDNNALSDEALRNNDLILCKAMGC